MSSFRSVISKNLGTYSLIVVLALSLGFNVYLAGRVNFHAPEPTVPIKAGAKLPSPLPLLGVNGKQALLAFHDARPTVIYVFSPLCPWCKRNEENIKTLVAKDGGGYRFVGLSTLDTNLKQYIAAGHAPFPVYLIKSQAQMRKLGLIGTPETIVVNSNGRVEKVWQGAYVGTSATDVEHFFGVKLPGLLSDATVVATPLQAIHKR